VSDIFFLSKIGLLAKNKLEKMAISEMSRIVQNLEKVRNRPIHNKGKKKN